MNTILVIEDNEFIRENVAEMLMLSDYKVLMAPNGLVGVDMILAHTPDLILCDIMMPGMDGYGVLDAMKKDPRSMNIPFVFMTSKSEKGDISSAMMLGADDYIVKPFDCNELVTKIDKLINGLTDI